MLYFVLSFVLSLPFMMLPAPLLFYLNPSDLPFASLLLSHQSDLARGAGNSPLPARAGSKLPDLSGESCLTAGSFLEGY